MRIAEGGDGIGALVVSEDEEDVGPGRAGGVGGGESAEREAEPGQQARGAAEAELNLVHGAYQERVVVRLKERGAA